MVQVIRSGTSWAVLLNSVMVSTRTTKGEALAYAREVSSWQQ